MKCADFRYEWTAVQIDNVKSKVDGGVIGRGSGDKARFRHIQSIGSVPVGIVQP